MTTEADNVWIEAQPGQGDEEVLITVPTGNQGNRAPGPRPKRTKKTLDDLAAKLRMDDPVQLTRIDIARELFGQMKAKSTILAAIKAGLPNQGVPELKDTKQAYVYYHRMIMEMQDDLLKTRSQKTSEHKARLLGLAKEAEKAGNHVVARQCLADVALIDQVANPHTAPRLLNLNPDPGARPLQAPEIPALDMEQLRSIINTGKLPEVKS